MVCVAHSNLLLPSPSSVTGPKSDIEAFGLMKEAWGNMDERELEQTDHRFPL